MKFDIAKLAAALSLAASFGAAAAQLPAPDPAQVAAMEKLSHWVGEWRGSGWAATGPEQRHEFEIVERVQPKIQGSVLLVEGRGTTRGPGGETLVSHEALAVLSWDPDTSRYGWRTYDLRGNVRDAEFTVTEDGAQWDFQTPDTGGMVRFSIAIEGDTWRESGRYSPDGGQTWYPMLQMTLQRQ